jgi:hypothetical protein
VARAAAEVLERALVAEETVHYGVHCGELRRFPSRDGGWEGEVTWYLATDRAVVTLEIKATSDNRGVTTELRLRQYPLATLQWSEIEETHAPGEPVYKLTLHFAGGKVEINSGSS